MRGLLLLLLVAPLLETRSNGGVFGDAFPELDDARRRDVEHMCFGKGRMALDPHLCEQRCFDTLQLLL